jgi:hypothetical protein
MSLAFARSEARGKPWAGDEGTVWPCVGNLGAAANGQVSDPISGVFDKDEGAGFEFCESRGDNRRETLIHGVGSFLGQPTDDDTRLVQHAKSEDVAKIEIEGHDDTRVGARTLDEVGISGTLRPKRPDVNRFMATCVQKRSRDFYGAERQIDAGRVCRRRGATIASR